MNEVENILCCGDAKLLQCCQTCEQCPCLSTRHSAVGGQTLIPGATVALYISFNGSGSFNVGGGVPGFGCPPSQPCCCAQCDYEPFFIGAEYELVGITTGGCGCKYLFEYRGSLGEPTPVPAWCTAVPATIELFCGPGENNPCLETGKEFCPECPPGTNDAGDKIRVKWTIPITMPQEPACPQIHGNCCEICLNTPCGPNSLICDPIDQGPVTPGGSIVAPCQGECSGGEGAVDLWICHAYCPGPGSCWRKVGVLSAAWAVTSTGQGCEETADPCASCSPE